MRNIAEFKEYWSMRAKLKGNTLGAVILDSSDWVLNELNSIVHKQNLEIINSEVLNTRLFLLDAGCGYGRISKELKVKKPNINIIGVDISRQFLYLWKKNLDEPAAVATINQLPFKDNVFNVIICNTALMYLQKQDRQRTLDEFRRTLKNGGKLLMTENNKWGVMFVNMVQKDFSFIKNILLKDVIELEGAAVFDEKELRNLLNQTDFKILKIIGSLVPFPIPLFLFYLNHKSSKIRRNLFTSIWPLRRLSVYLTFVAVK